MLRRKITDFLLKFYVDEKGVEHYPLFAVAFLFRTDIDKLMANKRA
jgi:hypothetical protein